ncbi:MAG: SGNH/GDSL hydrolase family protein [Alicyclobacillus sp.]|nr:SGNH/GDSL hydrolase family protein [Alicyclobacillus sp.]
MYRWSHRRRNRKLWASVAAAVVAAVAGISYNAYQRAVHASPLETFYIHQQPDVPDVARVMIVGGSVARGWRDGGHGGYLVRAFEDLPGDVPVTVVNAAVIGDGPVEYASKFTTDLALVKPTVLLISWGMLDDIHAHTPLNQFDGAIHDEIATALANHMTVMVVTPPVTRATYTQYAQQEPDYVDSEIKVAKSFHDPNVHVFNLFEQMKHYLAAHHLSYERYAADGWHPNTLGHELSGSLLSADIQQVTLAHVVNFVVPPAKPRSVAETHEGKNTSA